MPQFGRNVVEFNNPSTQVKTATPSDHVLAYIGETNTPVYIPVSDLQNAILKEPINESVSAQGIDGNTTAKLDYGVNVITSASATDFAIRLPFPPIKGRTVTIINNTVFNIVVYPSISGGSINGVINGTATIPPNKISYTFTCWENPLPGAWSWTPPATAQWDSGEITINTTANNTVVSAQSPSVWLEGGTTFRNSISWAVDSLNKPVFQLARLESGIAVAPFKPSTPWNSATKLKVYTNLAATANNVIFELAQGSCINYYEANTANYVLNNSGNSSGYGDLGYCNQTVSGASLPAGTLTANIGDAGTCYGVADLTTISAFTNTKIGDYYLGVENILGVDCDKYLSRYINFAILPNRVLTGLKIRFFIEYN